MQRVPDASTDAEAAAEAAALVPCDAAVAPARSPAASSPTLLDALSCPICLCIMAQPCTAACGQHNFCLGCLADWIVTRQPHPLCPLCARAIQTDATSLRVNCALREACAARAARGPKPPSPLHARTDAEVSQGAALYRLVAAHEPARAGKITGMLLLLPPEEVAWLLHNDSALAARVHDAVLALDAQVAATEEVAAVALSAAAALSRLPPPALSLLSLPAPPSPPAPLPPPAPPPPVRPDPPRSRDALGLSLFPLVAAIIEEGRAAKVTGMLLELPEEEVGWLLESPTSLVHRVTEAVAALDRHTAQGGDAEAGGDRGATLVVAAGSWEGDLDRVAPTLSTGVISHPSIDDGAGVGLSFSAPPLARAREWPLAGIYATMEAVSSTPPPSSSRPLSSPPNPPSVSSPPVSESPNQPEVLSVATGDATGDATCDAAGTSDAPSRDALGLALYPLVAALAPAQAGKVTGILLQLPSDEVCFLVATPDALAERVRDAVVVLDTRAQASPPASPITQRTREARGLMLFQRVAALAPECARKVTGMLLLLPEHELSHLLASQVALAERVHGAIALLANKPSF